MIAAHISTLDRLAALLHAHRFRFTTEDELQLGIQSVLSESGEPHLREVALLPGQRIDFLCADGVGIEVKIGGSELALSRQLQRYAQCESITALLVVSTRARHAQAPPSLGGKPIRVVHLIGSML